MREVKDEIAAYVAGIVDGEGYIGIAKTKKTGSMRSTRYAGVLIVGNTSRRLIEELVGAFGVGSVSYRRGGERTKGCFLWAIQSRNARDVLARVRPYLVIKRAQAELVIEFVDGFESFKGGRPGKFGGQTVSERELARRSRIYDEIRRLNRVGPGTDDVAVQMDEGKQSRGMTAEFAVDPPARPTT
jgi:hypothetical protein